MAYTTINKSTDYFNTKLYTGTGSSNALTGVGFQPDWVWMKRRDGTSSHRLCDAVRGATKLLQSSASDAEQTGADTLTSFDSDGFTLGADAAPYNVNVNSQTMAAWCWKAGGSGSSNSDGSITSTVSASTTSGFSIVTWTGNSGSIGHGLGVKPAMIVAKSRGATGGWYVTHKSLSAEMQDNYMFWNTNSANTTNNNIWGGEPTTSTFSVGSGLIGNTTHVAYVFAEKTGFSKFGKYTGNGNADGPFVYTGFKPAFVLVKNASTANNWFIQDNKRLGYNGANHLQKTNTNGADDTGTHIDILSNGFKTIVSSANCNGNNNTMIYMAFAEAPLVGSNNIPATAR